MLWLTCVNVRVLLHIRLLVEPLAAVLAGVRPGVWVDEQVRGQGGGALEWFPTHLALKTFFLINDKKVQKHWLDESGMWETAAEEIISLQGQFTVVLVLKHDLHQQMDFAQSSRNCRCYSWFKFLNQDRWAVFESEIPCQLGKIQVEEDEWEPQKNN